ncbi:serine/threonine-protein kinase [Streptomyces bungoensis]|uniref:serine/threonine-protein kinase n=1 Tax=Streptomyces bungoensis TaxID=285568 RepID=UPI0034230F4C
MQPLGAGEPATVGPYRLLGRLGSGGMGRVYLGRSAGGRTVAVKIVHPHFALDEEFRARFRREVEAARRVGGAWTAPVLDADPEAAVPWVATGYAAGPSLAAAVADAGPLPAHTVRALGAGLAEALAAVHELGLVHRDVKPSNVLLTLDGPLLIDFGIARATDGTASLTSTGVSVGSPGYMSPEQILGKGVTGAADVFSLGAVLVHAATGAPPFPGDSSAALLYKVVHEEPELGSLAGELREVAAACLAKDPTARPTPADLARRLAPEGAAHLVTGGWLPGPLVEQVSRAAVRLLNLDTGEVAPSGVVEFSRTSVAGPETAADSSTADSGAVHGAGPIAGQVPASGAAAASPASGRVSGVDAGPGSGRMPGAGAEPGSAGSGGSEAGESGARSEGSEAGVAAEGSLAGPAPMAKQVSAPGAAVAPPVPGGVSGLDAGPGSGRVSGAGAGPGGSEAAESGAGAEGSGDGQFGPAPLMGPAGVGPGGVQGVVPVPRDAPPGDGAPPRGRLTVSVAAGSTPGASGRGRTVSCTVALAVAGALAVGAVGIGALLRPWTGGENDTAGSGPAATRTPGPSSPDPGDGAKAGTVPARYLGTWEGPATGLGGSLPMGTFRLTVHRAAVGEEFGRLTQTDQLGGVCTDILTLKQVTKTRIVATSTGAEGNHAGCDPAPHPVQLTPVGDDLRYTSDSAAEGNPVSRMQRAG